MPYIVPFIIVAIILVFLIPSIMLRLAISTVVKEFREQNAVSPDNAKYDIELGIKPQTVIDRFVQNRDYKPQALRTLIEAEIIILTEDGKLYLRENKLISTRWAKN